MNMALVTMIAPNSKNENTSWKLINSSHAHVNKPFVVELKLQPETTISTGNGLTETWWHEIAIFFLCCYGKVGGYLCGPLLSNIKAFALTVQM